MTDEVTIRIEGRAGGVAFATLAPAAEAPDMAVLLLEEARLAGLVEVLTEAGYHVLILRDLPAEDRQGISVMEAACEWIRKNLAAESLVAIGAGEGGTRAFLLGCMSSLPQAVINIEGPLIRSELSREQPFQPLEMALNLSCPLLAIYGEESSALGPQDRAYSSEVLSQFARTFDIVTRNGVGQNPLESVEFARILTFLEQARE